MEIGNDIMMDFRKHNEEFAALAKQVETMDSENPFINRVLFGEGEVDLTAEEHEVLVRFLKLAFERDSMGQQQIYFRGHTDAVAYLRRIGAI